ncbi:MAG TPA: PAS domain S-box protein [Rhizomicrobium sp.]|jgi:PAS domain S-box-containing protein
MNRSFSRLAVLLSRGDDTYRNILDSLPAAVYATDAEGRITYYNQAAVQLWGHRPVLGTSLWCGSWKLFWPDGRPMPHDECPMAVAIRERRPVRNEEAILERPNGTRVPFIPYPTPLYGSDDQFIGAVNMLVETGDRKRANEYAERLSAIVESSDDAIISKDLNGIITSWNAGAQRLFGYGADEIVGKSITVLIPEERLNEEDDILARIRRGERVEHFETVRRHKDGSLVDLSLCISPVKNANGRIVGASKIARDITERKRAHQKQMLLLNEMKHRVKNTLAMAQALAMQTLRSASNDELAAFSARLNALGCAQDLLTLESWDRLLLGDVIAEALKPFEEQSRKRIVASGSGDAWLDGPKSQLLAMVLHELATNAVKYGALSNSTGRVHIGWQLAENSPSVMLRWQESGGPPVAPPQRKGFGSKLIERSLGHANFDYRREGLVCTWDIALRSGDASSLRERAG